MARSNSLGTLFRGLFRGNSINDALLGNNTIRTLMEILDIDPNSISRNDIDSLSPSDEIMLLVLQILLRR